MSDDGRTVALSVDRKTPSGLSSFLEVWRKDVGWSTTSIPRQVTRLELSADGQRLLAVSDGLAVYDVPPRNAIALRFSETYDVNGRVRDFTAARDGRLIAVGLANGDIRLVRPDCRVEPVLRLRGHQSAIGKLHLSRDRRVLYSLSEDGLLRRWDLTAPRPGDPLAAMGRCGRSFDVLWLDLSGDRGRVLLAAGLRPSRLSRHSWASRRRCGARPSDRS